MQIWWKQFGRGSTSYLLVERSLFSLNQEELAKLSGYLNFFCLTRCHCQPIQNNLEMSPMVFNNKNHPIDFDSKTVYDLKRHSESGIILKL